jgi:hypothetical protein
MTFLLEEIEEVTSDEGFNADFKLVAGIHDPSRSFP